jgi:hypothetical protein
MLCLYRNKYERPLAMGGKKLNPQDPFNEATAQATWSIWLLKISIIGNYCISHPKGFHPSSELHLLRTKVLQ